jgi:Calcineurin-like phosphoesterase
MATRKIDPTVYAKFAETESNRQIARRFGVDESTVRRALDSIGFQRDLIPVEGPTWDERFNIVLDKPITHIGNIMITADWHIPLYDPKYVNEMIRTARSESLDTLCIAGDFFNFDALSAYSPKQESAGLEKELEEAVSVMRVLLETFETIYFLWGNHDARMHTALGFKLQFSTAMKQCFGILGDEALERIVFTNLDHMWIEDGHGGTPWYICHPQNYTRTALSSAAKIASKVNANVITAHSHHCAVGYGVDGQKVVAEAGGLFDRTKTAYLQRSTTFPTWQQGYAWLKDGQLNVTSPGWNLN